MRLVRWLRYLHWSVYPWIAFVLAVFYANWGELLGIKLGALLTVYNFAYSGLVLHAMYLVGAWLDGYVRVPGEGEDRFVTPLALGVSAWIFFVTALGFLGILYSGVIVGSVLLVHVLRLRALVSALRALPERARTWWSTSLRVQDVVAWSLPAGFLVIALLRSLAPPLGPDELIQHLNGPARRLQLHNFALTDETRTMGGMQNATILYTIALAGPGGDAPAKLINFALLVLLVVSTRALCRQQFPRISSALVVLLLLAQPVVGYVSARPYADMLVAWMVAMSLLHVLRYVSDRKNASLLLSSLFLGIALGARLTMACAAIGIGVALCAALKAHGASLRTSLTKPVLWGSLAACTTVAWLGWNWYYIGSPVYPLFADFFSSKANQPLADSFFPEINRSLSHARGVLDTMLLPFTLITSHDPPNGVWGSIPFPAFLGFLPLVLIAFRSQWQAWFLLIYSVIYFVLWSRNMNFLRYLIPVFAAYAILCVAATRWLAEQLGGLRGRVFYLVLVTTLALVPSSLELFERSAVPGHVLALQYAVGRLSRAEFYGGTSFGPTYRMSEYCNRMLDPVHSRVRFFGSAQTYYVQVPHVPDGSSHGELHDLEASADWDADKFRKLLEDRGITHVVFDPSLYWGLFQAPNAVYGRVPEVRAKAARSVEFFQRFAAEQMELVHRENPMLLYAWKPAATPAGPYTGALPPQP
jgi:hypothetical protein